VEWEPIQLSSSLASLAFSPAISSGISSGNSAGAVTLAGTSPVPLNLSIPLTVTPSPTPSPSSEPDSTTSPSPAPTVTVTQTVQPSLSEVSGTVKLDELQFLGITTGLVLLLVFAAAIFAAQLRRP